MLAWAAQSSPSLCPLSRPAGWRGPADQAVASMHPCCTLASTPGSSQAGSTTLLRACSDAFVLGACVALMPPQAPPAGLAGKEHGVHCRGIQGHDQVCASLQVPAIQPLRPPRHPSRLCGRAASSMLGSSLSGISCCMEAMRRAALRCVSQAPPAAQPRVHSCLLCLRGRPGLHRRGSTGRQALAAPWLLPWCMPLCQAGADSAAGTCSAACKRGQQGPLSADQLLLPARAQGCTGSKAVRSADWLLASQSCSLISAGSSGAPKHVLGLSQALGCLHMLSRPAAAGFRKGFCSSERGSCFA